MAPSELDRKTNAVALTNDVEPGQHRAESFADLHHDLRQNIAIAIQGSDEAIDLALLCLIAEGHLLVEDVPGVGKTTLAKALATSIDEIRAQALALQAKGPGTVLITGGRLDGEDVVDVLVHEGGTDLLRARRVAGRRVRGAGSTLSAAIAAQLARIAEFDRAGELGEIGAAGTEDDMVTIVASAREFVASATENAQGWEISRHDGGFGPVNHLITLDKD